MRARLARSEAPNRIFERTLDGARAAGLVGVRRVLDSTPSTTRSRRWTRSPSSDELRGLLVRDDDYRAAGKPACDYEDRTAREALVDALACDGHALLTALDGERLPAPLAEAATLLATVLGQDLDEGLDGVFRIARRVAPDRVISTVDPDARHLLTRCTTSTDSRTITVGLHEARLRRDQAAQRDPAWLADYRATRPKVERKIGHLMRRRHGGRRARVRGRVRVGADFALLAAAVNLARLAVLGLVRSGDTWAVRAT